MPAHDLTVTLEATVADKARWRRVISALKRFASQIAAASTIEGREFLDASQAAAHETVSEFPGLPVGTGRLIHNIRAMGRRQ